MFGGLLGEGGGRGGLPALTHTHSTGAVLMT